MKTVVHFFHVLSEWLQRSFLFVSCIILCFMVVVGGLGIVYRFVLKSSLSWNEELLGYLFVWLTCLGAAIGYKLGAHPSVLIMVERLPERLRSVTVVISDLVVFTLGVIFLLYGGQMIFRMGTETASSLPISMRYPYAAIPIGGMALIVHSLDHMMANATRRVNDRHEVSKEQQWER